MSQARRTTKAHRAPQEKALRADRRSAATDEDESDTIEEYVEELDRIALRDPVTRCTRLWPPSLGKLAHRRLQSLEFSRKQIDCCVFVIGCLACGIFRAVYARLCPPALPPVPSQADTSEEPYTIFFPEAFVKEMIVDMLELAVPICEAMTDPMPWCANTPLIAAWTRRVKAPHVRLRTPCD